jgi:hypothetical protein
VFPSRYVSCDACGTSLERHERDAHACDPERRLHFELFQLRDELDRFESELALYLASPRGRFEVWYAERRRV